MISVCFQGKSFNTTVIQVYAPTTDAREAEVDWFCEDLKHLLELIPKTDNLFIRGDWSAKVVSQKVSAITGTFGLGVRNEAGNRVLPRIHDHGEHPLSTREAMLCMEISRWSALKSD